MSASTEAAQLVELFQLQSDQGPCLDCYTSGHQVHVGVPAHETRWPRFVTRAREHGFAAVHAIPLRLRTKARRARRRLSDLADSVVDGTLDTTDLLG